MQHLILLILTSLTVYPTVSVSEKSPTSCQPGKFKYIKNRETNVLFLDICEMKKGLVSRTCLNRSCSLIKKLKSSKEIKYKGFGSPHYTNCLNIGGVPISGDLKYDKTKKQNWKPVFLCFNKKKNEFLDSGFLFKRPK